MSLIQVNKLIKKYSDFTAVDDISFEVEEGECLGILGPNGAGKTTTVRIIQCVSPLTSGEVIVLGKKASVDERQIRAELGVVPQDNDLDNDLTVIQNLSLFTRFYGIPNKEARMRIEKQLEFFELKEKLNSRIEELSGGMKRRLLLARSLLNDPKVLILDEPTNGLDPQARHLVWQKLRTLKERGVTMILNTHYMEEAQQICDRLLILDKGKILKTGQPLELIRKEIGREVVEIRDYGDINAILKKLSGLTFKSEAVGDTFYLYCEDSQEIMNCLSECHECAILRRPAALEDLFLKLTGRGLQE
jgi:lipooligosaccharide transport system ATP-binding protein